MTEMLSTEPKTCKQVVNPSSSDAGNSVQGAMAETQSSREGGLCVAQVVLASAAAAKAGWQLFCPGSLPIFATV